MAPTELSYFTQLNNLRIGGLTLETQLKRCKASQLASGEKVNKLYQKFFCKFSACVLAATRAHHSAQNSGAGGSKSELKLSFSIEFSYY